MAAKFTSTAEERGPGRGSRPGNRTVPADYRARPRAGMGDTTLWRPSAAHQPARRCEAHCKRSSSLHARDAGRFGRFDRWSNPRRRNRSPPHAGDRTRRCWPPTLLRSVQRSAPSRQPVRSEGISPPAGASANHPFSELPTNHAEGRESRSGSRRVCAMAPSLRRPGIRKRNLSARGAEITAYVRCCCAGRVSPDTRRPAPYPKANLDAQVQP
jgi:hypothetical protein